MNTEPNLKLKDFKFVENINSHLSFVNCLLVISIEMKPILLTGSNDSTIKSWDFSKSSSLQCLNTFIGHEDCINSICYLSDSKQIASGGDDKKVIIWNIETGEKLRELLGHDESIICVISVGEYLVSGGDDRTLIFWSNNDGTQVKRVEAHDAGVMCSVHLFRNDKYNFENHHFATGSDDKTVKIWSKENNLPIKVLKGHNQCIMCIIYCKVSEDVFGLFTGSYDKSIIFWDLAKGEVFKKFEIHQACVWSLAEIAPGFLVSASEDLSVKVTNLSTFEENAKLVGHQDTITCVAAVLVQERTLIVSGGLDNTLSIWAET